MIDKPPSDPAVQATNDEPIVFVEVTVVAVTPVGATGGPCGTTAVDAADAGPVPAEFVAVTVNMYEVPLVRPETVHTFVEVVHVFESGIEVTVNELTAKPPVDVGADHDTTDVPV